MQDNCAPHTAARHWFENNDEIELLRDWPANSTDLNLIEDMWADWENQIASNRENLENAIIAKWESFRGNTEYFKNLYESMPRRLHQVIANGGGPTSY